MEGDEATLTCTVPMPSDGVMSESASVLDFVKSSPLKRTRTSPTQCRKVPPSTSSGIFCRYWKTRNEQPGVGHQAVVIEGDFNAVGVLAW